ncbi:MAG: Membrane-bound lytic murein transglycosylase B [Paracidovorax wautersii]|uniref:Membrane-bound lytic murein transglycosylase B n=1 Tax=Paracidovorax wautersii TaxID=1177982 RepID=A0A7V8FMA3_9BURK|nr:MAG: Membrane-bound lytic murein transglycosylase B [Paracidovorax wautersii]
MGPNRHRLAPDHLPALTSPSADTAPRRRQLLTLLGASALAPGAWAQQADSASTLYATRPDAMAYARTLADAHLLPLDWVLDTVGQARFLPRVPPLMVPSTRPAARNWAVYRSRFVEPIRIRAARAFVDRHAGTLQRAEREFGVPMGIVAGILGVETIYGRNMGNISVLDALGTLSFDFPAAHPRAQARTTYFRGELGTFLALSFRARRDPRGYLGSYAGAMGLPQFMPSSWEKYAIDYDGDGVVDLFSSVADAIGSVANYFIAHGWTPGMPTHFPVQFDTARLQLPTLLAPDILPSFSPQEMQALGVVLPEAALAHAGKLALIELPNGSGPSNYVAGTTNFYAITRYNWSSFYAMSVIELGDAASA